MFRQRENVDLLIPKPASFFCLFETVFQVSKIVNSFLTFQEGSSGKFFEPATLLLPIRHVCLYKWCAQLFYWQRS